MAVKTRSWKGKPDAWEVDVSTTLPNGRPYRKKKVVNGMTEKQAMRWGEQHLALVLVGGPAAVARPEKKKEVPTVAEFEDTYIEHCEAIRLKVSTVAMKRCALRRHIKPVMGDVPLDQVGTAHLAKVRAKMKSLNAQTVNNTLSIVNQMLVVAAELGTIAPVHLKLGLLPVTVKEAAFYDFADLARLIDGARKTGPEAVVLVLLAAHAGLRRGELRALRWSDIDLENKRLTVNQAVWGKDKMGLPKGGRSRVVMMTDTLTAALKSFRHLRGKYVLGNHANVIIDVGTVRTIMQHAQRRAGMEETGRCHVLRHTYCSHLAMKGASITAIQHLAGHAKISTTMRYMHLSPAAKREAVQLLDTSYVDGLSTVKAEAES